MFRVNYLGGDMPTFTLNFSRPGNQIVGQYFNFIRLGHEGYRSIMTTLHKVATDLARRIASHDDLALVSDGSDTPVFAVRANPGAPFDVFGLSAQLRRDGWQVPAYTMPPNAESVAVLRFVIREGFSADLADLLLLSLDAAITRCREGDGDDAQHFAHT